MAATSIVLQLNPRGGRGKGRRRPWMGSVEPKLTGLENRQWPSRSFVGSNPTPAAEATASRSSQAVSLRWAPAYEAEGARV